MKTFSDLILEVQNQGLCHRCGGCVTFCTAINYGALELGEDGKPRYKEMEKCIKCGLCYVICPEIPELEEETKKHVSWTAPLGPILQLTAARSKDPEVHAKATDGGVVTTLLLHLLQKGFIEGAIVTKKVGLFRRVPWLARSRDEILEAAGFNFDTSHGMELYSDIYSSYSPSITQFKQLADQHLTRVAFVGTPCQINTLRRMEVMGIVPSDSIKYCLGLFCTGNFVFGQEQWEQLERIGNFKWEEVQKVNVKEELMIHLSNKKVRLIQLDKLDFMKRDACRFCADYSGEFADISFGGLGSAEGWTTVITRTSIGRSLFADALRAAIEEYNFKDNPDYNTQQAEDKLLEWSEKKKQKAKVIRKKLEA